MTTIATCSVCNNDVTSNYCGNCGQKIGKKEINIWGVISDAFSNYFSFEKSGLATVIKILTKPKFIVDNYCSGNKGYYLSPGRMLMFSIIVLIIHLTFIDSERILGVIIDFAQFNVEYAYWLIMLPFFTLISQIVFLRQGANLSKHFVSITYLATTFAIILTILSDSLFSIFGDFTRGMLFLIYVAFIFSWNSFALLKNRTFWIYLINFLAQAFLFCLAIFIIVVFLSSDS